MPVDEETWPALPLEEWRDTRDTIHMWTQIVGKIRLKLAPHVNHWWQVPLYLTSRGLTTTPIPFRGRAFDVTFDFIDHVLIVQTDDGRAERIALRPQPVADFYRDLMAALGRLGIDVRIWTVPSEMPDPIRFEQDRQHAAYDAAYAHRAWRVLLAADEILKEFRAFFIGKVSPVHFFWGGFDLAVTRFSGRRAPERPGADSITREGYSHEVSSCGFWFGSGSLTGPAFYSYAAPEPPGFKEAPIRPASAFYSPELSIFLLPYDEMREASDPRSAVLAFLQSTYEAAATLGHWDRENLERR
ncbi:MAG TPA: DUF5996 family protein [Vicinamibacterales bacterium]|jgi:hypothetical protein|nr:DUF5996 family protein [Vicinamibacterales bacterium]